MSVSISERIKKRRVEQGLTLLQVAEYIGVKEATAQRYESGEIKNIKHDTVQKLSEILHCSPAYLMGWEHSPTSDNSPPPDDITTKYPGIYRPKFRKVPLLGGVACGQPIYSPSFGDGFALINDNIPADFALRAKGDSMINAGINDGDVVFFAEQGMVENGQIAAVFIDDEVTLKRVYYYREKNKLVLQPENPKFEPLVYTGYELDEIHIIGLAVAQLRKIK